MTTVKVEASRTYDIIIGSDLLKEVGSRLAELRLGDTVLVVSDDNVAPLYLDKVVKSLEASAFKVVTYVFPHGENSKCAKTFVEILERAAEAHLCRKDTILALGGGVTGDLSGFAAASFMRGINFVQVPTTLLAAVDSSVGGKTAIDLVGGKNLAGAFYQPRLVLCDIDTLDTLPADIFTDGSAEVIKYGVLEDGYIIDLLNKINSESGLARKSDLEKLIARCVEIKAEYVHDDEFDNGRRAYLNLGHTYGHAIELLSKYETPHGKAVATGMVVATQIANKLGFCNQDLVEEMTKIIDEAGFDVVPAYSYDELTEAVKSDKKRIGAKVTMILPQTIGRCIDKEILWTDLRDLKW